MDNPALLFHTHNKNDLIETWVQDKLIVDGWVQVSSFLFLIGG